ncbi:MAG: L-aspartate oxidase [Deltaproteobacteria bacterium]|nr:L-aspartate oxidase [Deltaproteobacteria bacterium]
MTIKTDVLIIGSGIAGLSSALKLADRFRVAVVTKREAMESNTRYAQGGIASVMSSADNFESHMKDTLTAGAGLCRRNVVEKIIGDGPRLIRELLKWGAKFSKKDRNEFDLGREGGHSRRRVLHSADTTGAMLESALLKSAAKTKKIRLFEFHTAIDLITTRKINGWGAGNRCLGAYVLDTKSGEIKVFEAGATLLATGGAGKAYLYTTNPDIATGDGLAMAYRAGAGMANLEFVQFHPTCLYNPGAWAPVTDRVGRQAGRAGAAGKGIPKERIFLISEALRGEGAKLLLADGERFMEKCHPMKELAPRDVVARAIDSEMKRTGAPYVLLDISHKKGAFIKKRFPHIYDTCKKSGYDPARGPIPVVPAAHYFCGGVVVDGEGKTEIGSLYAIGETACTGLHGANRLASNSLLEGVATADYASQAIIRDLPKTKKTGTAIPPWDPGKAVDSNEAVVITQNWDEIRRFMWNYVGIVRTDKIRNLKEEIREYYWNFKITRDLVELRNLADVAEMIIDCAMARKESRGLHYNLDYPEPKESEKKDTVIRHTPL